MPDDPKPFHYLDLFDEHNLFSSFQEPCPGIVCGINIETFGHYANTKARAIYSVLRHAFRDDPGVRIIVIAFQDELPPMPIRVGAWTNDSQTRNHWDSTLLTEANCVIDKLHEAFSS